MEIGLYTFAELYPDPRTGRTISPEHRLKNLLEEVELAEQVGLDVYGIGEHYRPEIFHHDRFLVQFSVGTMPHELTMRSIELLGTEVAPAVHAELERRVVAESP